MPVLESHRQLINDAILSLGIDPSICQQTDAPNIWQLHRGTAQIIIAAQDSATHLEDTVATVSMMSPLVQLPENYEQLTAIYDYLLEKNHLLITETFSLSNRWIILSSTYYLDDMRRQEVMQLLDSLSFHAQKFGQEITEQFELASPSTETTEQDSNEAV
ncbi:MAG: YbjN domain-containing protein [Aureispira sp.]